VVAVLRAVAVALTVALALAPVLELAVADAPPVAVGLGEAVAVADVLVLGVALTVDVGLAVVVAVDVGVLHAGRVTTLSSMVTAPLRARARPSMEAPVSNVIDVSARMPPRNMVFVPRVAELPTCQNTLHA